MEVRRTVDELIERIGDLRGEVEEGKIAELRRMAEKVRYDRENDAAMLEAAKLDLERLRAKISMLEGIVSAIVEAVC